MRIVDGAYKDLSGCIAFATENGCVECGVVRRSVERYDLNPVVDAGGD